MGNNNNYFFDLEYDESEQIPRIFTVNFKSLKTTSKTTTKILVDGVQAGCLIDDNSRIADGYRFHDVFHYTFATMLGWSPCTRSLLKRKRKSNPVIDGFEDGARATITEEAISLIIFNQAKRNNFYDSTLKLKSSLLDQIMELTSTFEVKIRSKDEWEDAILLGYSLFRSLVQNEGGTIHYNMLERTAIYEK